MWSWLENLNRALSWLWNCLVVPLAACSCRDNLNWVWICGKSIVKAWIKHIVVAKTINKHEVCQASFFLGKPFSFSMTIINSGWKCIFQFLKQKLVQLWNSGVNTRKHACLLKYLSYSFAWSILVGFVIVVFSFSFHKSSQTFWIICFYFPLNVFKHNISNVIYTRWNLGIITRVIHTTINVIMNGYSNYKLDISFLSSALFHTTIEIAIQSTSNLPPGFKSYILVFYY